MTDLTASLEERPGRLCRPREATGNAGINIEVRLVLGVDDVDKARAAL